MLGNEPTTYRLQGDCSTTELMRLYWCGHGGSNSELRFGRPWFCQLKLCTRKLCAYTVIVHDLLILISHIICHISFRQTNMQDSRNCNSTTKTLERSALGDIPILHLANGMILHALDNWRKWHKHTYLGRPLPIFKDLNVGVNE